jgi:uncharacterized protein
VNFTLKERLALANQYTILEKLSGDEDDAKHYAQLRTIVQDGLTLEYEDLFSGIEKEELTEQQCNEVIDILDMYRHITDSYEALPDKEGLTPADVRFPGFDGNDALESRYAAYVELHLDQRKWRELQDRKGNLNSHRQMLEKYRLMLAVHKRFKRRSGLSKAQIDQLLYARAD